MAFLPIDLPITEILLTNFVTDIATISNANDLILKDKIEDVVNQLEIDTVALTIGTDNPINYVRAQSFIIQDTGFTFQTGTPSQIIAKLEKNTNTESVLTVDNLNVNLIAGVENLSVNSLTVNTDLTVDGPAVVNSSLECKAAMIDSKETVTLTLSKASATQAEAILTLTSASKRHIFVKLKAVSAPNLNFVYDGVGGFGTITKFVLYIDFDANNPPAQNTTFTIHLVDIVEETASVSILTDVNANVINTTIAGGTNQSALPAPAAILLHNGSGTLNLGINMASINPASSVLLSNFHYYYGHSATFTYILDEITNDRLIVDSMVGMEFF